MDLDSIYSKWATTFHGLVVHNRLGRETKPGFSMSLYVLESLRGRYCTSTNSEVASKGLKHVRDTLSRNYGRAHKSAKTRGLTRQRDFADIPTEVLDKIQIIFYSDPINAAFRALGMD